MSVRILVYSVEALYFLLDILPGCSVTIETEVLMFPTIIWELPVSPLNYDGFFFMYFGAFFFPSVYSLSFLYLPNGLTLLLLLNVSLYV